MLRYLTEMKRGCAGPGDIALAFLFAKLSLLAGFSRCVLMLMDGFMCLMSMLLLTRPEFVLFVYGMVCVPFGKSNDPISQGIFAFPASIGGCTFLLKVYYVSYIMSFAPVGRPKKCLEDPPLP